jgi:hypothetical protein
MKILVLFAEYLMHGIRAVRIRIIMFQRSLLKRRKNRLPKYPKRLLQDNTSTASVEQGEEKHK